MATPYGKTALASRDSGPQYSQFDTGMTIDGQPADQFLDENHGKPLYENEEPAQAPLYSRRSQLPVPTTSSSYIWNTVQTEALITGETSGGASMAESVKNGTDITSFFTETMIAKYNDGLMDYGTLWNLSEKPVAEQLDRINYEAARLDYAKEDMKTLVAISMLREGYGSLPERAIDEVVRTITPFQAQGLREQYRQGQIEELQQAVNEIVAAEGVGLSSGLLAAEMIQQDVVPFYGAAIRIGNTNVFVPEELDLSNIKRVLPGETRQAIREFLVNATPQERIDYVRGLQKEFKILKSGPMAAHFTQYGILENLMGIFTEDLINEGSPADGWDRFLGNLDVVLGGVIAVGATFKRGTSVLGLFKRNKAIAAYNNALAAGNHAAAAKIQAQIHKTADKFGITPAEAAFVDLARPAGPHLELDVLPDEVVDAVSRMEHQRKGILDTLDDTTGLGLNADDKARVTSTFVDDLSNADGMHTNHQMTEIGHLPNDVGIRVTVHYGEKPGRGWIEFGHLVEDLIEIDKDLKFHKIVKRNSAGKLEEVPITDIDIGRFVAKGIVPAAVENGLDPFAASSRLFGGRKLSTVDKNELFDVAQDLDPKGVDFYNISNEIARRKSEHSSLDVLTSLDGEEYFLARTVDRYWTTVDKANLSKTFNDTSAIPLPDHLIPPNVLFTDAFSEVNRAFFKEVSAHAQFSQLQKGFTDLSLKSKVLVGRIFEWAEDWAKDMHTASGEAKGPSMLEIMDHFPEMTNKEMIGYLSYRASQDVMYEVFNRRLYRDFSTKGYVTARSVDGAGANYHGLENKNVSPGTYYDPYTQKPVKLADSDAVKDIYDNGGTFIDLDIAIDGPKGTGQFTRVIVKSGDYEVGPLSHNPLQYYEGYTPRVYEDPHYIVKHNLAPMVNGAVSEKAISEATRTAGSMGEAQRHIRRLAGRKGKNIMKDDLGRTIDPDDPSIRWEVRRAKNISNQEGTLYQQQGIYREGRLFWDDRNRERLPDVNGNKAKIEDIQQTLEKTTAMALRQSTQEDMFKTIKNAFGNEFANIPEVERGLKNDDVGEIITDLKRALSNATDPEYKKRISKAIALAKYIQVQLGTDSAKVPELRLAMLRLAEGVSTIGGGEYKLANRFGGWLEKRAAEADPFRFARSIAYNAFMVARPGRQLALQSMQITYLTAIDPAYIGSLAVARDAFGLKRGLSKLRRAGFDDGWSDAAVAKYMGLSKKEYKRLVEEFSRSGLYDSVNVHSYNPSAKQAGRAKLSTTLPGRFMYHSRVLGKKVHGLLEQGFNIGETNNLTMTYMVALRRAKKKYNVKSLTEFSRQQFDEIALDASNLGLAMTKPNKFSYQSGAAGTMFQFLAFSHKATLGFFGLNPALKGKGLRIALTTYALYGSNIFGGEDFIREGLSRMGLSGSANREIVPGMTLQDVLAAGLIESSFNALGHASSEEWQDLDIGSFAPGANVAMIYKEFLSGVVEGNIPLTTATGPSGTPLAGIMKAWAFASNHIDNDVRSPAQKVVDVAAMASRNVFPQVNDAVRAWYAYQTGMWLDKAGDKLPVRAAWNSIVARGVFGIRPKEEMAYYEVSQLTFKDQKNIDNAVQANKEYMKELLMGWSGGEYDDEFIMQMVGGLMSLYENADEGTRMIIYKRSLLDGAPGNPSIVEMIAKRAASGTANLDSLIPWVENQPDWSPEQIRQTTDLIRDIQTGYKGADMIFKQQLEDGRIQ